jgi:hypothetical protein
MLAGHFDPHADAYFLANGGATDAADPTDIAEI